MPDARYQPLASRIHRLQDECAIWLLDLRPDSDIADNLSGRQALRHALQTVALAMHFQIDPAEVKIHRADFQMPKIELPYGQKGFVSFSSSKDCGLVAFAEHPIGVDIEWIEPFQIDQTLDHFFSAQEATAVRSSADPILAFYEGWTQKEAASKVFGEGIAADFRVIPPGGTWNHPQGAIRSRLIEAPSGFAAAVAVSALPVLQ